MIPDYTPKAPSSLSTDSKLIGSWLSELDQLRTMKGYTFRADGSGDYFLWYTYEKLYAHIAYFSYWVENDLLLLVFENFSHPCRIPYVIEEEQLKLKRTTYSEIYTIQSLDLFDRIEQKESVNTI